MNTATQQTIKKPGVNKLVLGFLTVAMAALFATGGAVSATGDNSSSPSQTGNGYGGQSVNVDLDLEVNGDDNIINIIFHFFTGG